MPGTHLHLVIPALLGPLPGMDQPGFAWPRASQTGLLLSRANTEAVAGATLEELLTALFGRDGRKAPPLPIAPLTYLADAGRRPTGWCMRADPVHLRADQGRLLLFGGEVLSLEGTEAQALASAINGHFRDQRWRLEAPVPQRWYLSLPAPARIATVPLARVSGRSIEGSLPRGAEGPAWHTILNEVQMLLHDHPVNAARERADRPTVNSVWFWGGGGLPDAFVADWSQVWSDHPLVIGLSRLAGLSCDPIPGTARPLAGSIPPGQSLAVLDRLEVAVRYGDETAWRQGIAALESDWIAPLLGALRARWLSSITLYPLNGMKYTLARGPLRRFWRRSRPFMAFG
jgi:hypothetical protein